MSNYTNRVNPTFAALTTLESGRRTANPIKLDQHVELPPYSQVGASHRSTVRIGYNDTPRATGLCISADGLIVTARHLIIGMRGKEKDAFDPNHFYAEFPCQEGALFPSEPISRTKSPSALPLQLISELPKFENPNEDIVIFQAPQTQDPYPSNSLTTLRPQKHSDVYTIGYPNGVAELTLGEVLDPSFQEAYDVVKETYSREKANMNFLRRFIHETALYIGRFSQQGIISTNEINAGSSGGPLFNGDGEVCGITTSTVDNLIINMRKHFVNIFGIPPQHLPLNQIAISQPMTRVLRLLEKLGANIQKIFDGEPSGLSSK